MCVEEVREVKEVKEGDGVYGISVNLLRAFPVPFPCPSRALPVPFPCPFLIGGGEVGGCFLLQVIVKGKGKGKGRVKDR